MPVDTVRTNIVEQSKNSLFSQLHELLLLNCFLNCTQIKKEEWSKGMSSPSFSLHGENPLLQELIAIAFNNCSRFCT